MSSKKFVVVIDPGHGGKDPGATAHGLKEKDLTLDLGLRLKKLLSGKVKVLLFGDVDARLTRDTDVFIPLKDRPTSAKDNAAAVFLSIHMNASTKQSVDGSEVWISRTPNQGSKTLAKGLLSELLKVTKVRDRGIQNKNWTVISPGLHAKNTAACLAEISFLSNPAQAKRLKDAKYRQAIAVALMKGVTGYLDTLATPVQTKGRDDAQVWAANIGGFGAENLTEAYAANWAQDKDSPDYRHLGAPGMSKAFVFKESHLADLCQYNSFTNLTSHGKKVLFGLRGCSVIENKATWAKSVTLTENMPNHKHANCVLGVWDRTAKKIFVVTGSTVPGLSSVKKQKKDKTGKIANLLPTGLYKFKVGTHLKSKPAKAIPGAFLMDQKVMVIRTFDDLIYEVTDVWDGPRNPGDNIHAGRHNHAKAFSSAGCSTAVGSYSGGKDHADWKKFREAAGLSSPAKSSENGRKFTYVLLTGREARLRSAGKGRNQLIRLRAGSSGAGVKALQLGLKNTGHYKGSISGDMDAATVNAYVQWQKKTDSGKADGIVTNKTARKLHFDMIKRQSLAKADAWEDTEPIAVMPLADSDDPLDDYYGNINGERIEAMTVQASWADAMATKMTQADVTWAADQDSPDYRHLNAPGMSKAFSFTAKHLADLCTFNNFKVDNHQDQVLFALRGCHIVEGAATWSTSVTLTEDEPNHQDARCVLGVWERASAKLFVVAASTVPNWRYMEKYRQGTTMANMLPTGRYVYKVGSHKKVPGAFRMSQSVVVVRSKDDLTYEVTDNWTGPANVGDNIHPAFLDQRKKGVRFSSAGCQTIPGHHKNGEDQRDWKDFREAAGLTSPPDSSEDGRQFVYVLLTGREARLRSEGNGAKTLGRLRFGSSGKRVELLQDGLTKAGYYSGSIDGDLGGNTTMAYVQWQRAVDSNKADSIVTPQTAKQLGFDLVKAKVLAGSKALEWT